MQARINAAVKIVYAIAIATVLIAALRPGTGREQQAVESLPVDERIDFCAALSAEQQQAWGCYP